MKAENSSIILSNELQVPSYTTGDGDTVVCLSQYGNVPQGRIASVIDMKCVLCFNKFSFSALFHVYDMTPCRLAVTDVSPPSSG